MSKKQEKTVTMNTGVITDGLLYYGIEHGNITQVHHSITTANLNDLCEIAKKYNIRVIWVCPSSSLSYGVKDNWSSYTLDSNHNAKCKLNRDGLPTFASVQRIHGTYEEKKLVFCGFPDFNPDYMNDSGSWALADTESAVTFLNAILLLQNKLDIYIMYNCGYMGIELMKKLTKDYQTETTDYTDLPDTDSQDILFSRYLTESEKEGYLHIFDRNSQYLASATGAYMGSGQPVQLDMTNPSGYGVYMDCIKSGKCGMWKVQVTGTKEYGNLIPDINYSQWVTTSTLQALLASGYDVKCTEGYYFEKSYRSLQSWASLLWKSRQELKQLASNNVDGAKEAYNLIKMIYTKGISWLSLNKAKIEKRVEQWHKQQWREEIVSLAAYRMMLKILELANKGYYPVFCYVDNIGYITQDSNPESVPDIMKRANELGGFKYVRTVPLNTIDLNIFTDKPLDVWTTIKHLAE